MSFPSNIRIILKYLYLEEIFKLIDETYLFRKKEYRYELPLFL